ncbi:hypothetical protein [Azotobacter chroococcum]|uniref:hypothetical protein n=1 Tax=Azotobacter chroococcum TaxID=353 RepID=UPI0010AE463E|nr:hypothetical protein [Azotobacter chroococcum]TKD35296.1 hypothetical protein FCG41_17810 [Azotobacter chroococcum]
MRATYILEGNLTAKQPLATCSKDLKDASERRNGKNSPIPVPSTQTAKGTRLMFPATGIRGKLRRALRDVLRENMIARTGNGKPLSLDEHYLLTLGGIKGAGEESKSTIALEAEWREKNPLLSLFGAGHAGVLGFMQGRLGVGNAICTEASEPVQFSGARTDDLFRNKEQVAFLSDDDVQALISRSEGNRDASAIRTAIKAKEKAHKASLKKNDEAISVALNTELEGLKTELEAVLNDSGASSVSVGMPLSGWQAIPADSVMDHCMTVANSTLVELGAMLTAIEQFSLHPILGAHYASGCGQVAGSWEVFKVVRGQGKVSQGTISFAPFTGLLEINAFPESDLFAAQEAFTQYLASDKFDLSIPSA